MKIAVLIALAATTGFGQSPIAAGSYGTTALNPTTFMQGLPLTGATFPAVRGSNMAMGDTDLYTAPTGKHGLVVSVGSYNTTVGAINSYIELKSGGTYYRLTATTSVPGSSAANPGVIGIILEPGESLSMNNSAVGMNANVSVIQFDSASPYRTVKILGPATGNQTLYTVPTGKTAWITTATGTGWGASPVAFIGDSGGAGTVNLCSVAFGGATTCATNSANLINFITGTANTRTNFQAGGITMNSGDFLVLNVTTGNAAQLTWVNVLEF